MYKETSSCWTNQSSWTNTNWSKPMKNEEKSTKSKKTWFSSAWAETHAQGTRWWKVSCLEEAESIHSLALKTSPNLQSPLSERCHFDFSGFSCFHVLVLPSKSLGLSIVGPKESRAVLSWGGGAHQKWVDSLMQSFIVLTKLWGGSKVICKNKPIETLDQMVVIQTLPIMIIQLLCLVYFARRRLFTWTNSRLSYSKRKTWFLIWDKKFVGMFCSVCYVPSFPY